MPASVVPAKGPGSKAAGIAMAFKLIEAAEERWRAVNAPHLPEDDGRVLCGLVTRLAIGRVPIQRLSREPVIPLDDPYRRERAHSTLNRSSGVRALRLRALISEKRGLNCAGILPERAGSSLTRPL